MSNNYLQHKSSNELLLVFQMDDGKKYAINSLYVLEIIPIIQLEKLQSTPKYIAGYMFYSGMNVNIIDFKSYLNSCEIKPFKLSDCIIFIKTNESIFGLVVNKICDICTFENINTQTLPYCTNESLIKLVYQFQNESISIVNIFAIENNIKNYNMTSTENSGTNLFPEDSTSTKILIKRRQNLYSKTKYAIQNAVKKENYLHFKVYTSNFALNIKYVKEIVKIPKNKAITLPSVPKYISKLINIKGSYINALDLALFMELTKNFNIEYNKLIILNIPEINLSFLASEIFYIKSLDENDVILKTDNKFDSRYITQEIFRENNTFSILNVEKIINDRKLYIKQGV